MIVDYIFWGIFGLLFICFITIWIIDAYRNIKEGNKKKHGI